MTDNTLYVLYLRESIYIQWQNSLCILTNGIIFLGFILEVITDFVNMRSWCMVMSIQVDVTNIVPMIGGSWLSTWNWILIQFINGRDSRNVWKKTWRWNLILKKFIPILKLINCNESVNFATCKTSIQPSKANWDFYCTWTPLIYSK